MQKLRNLDVYLILTQEAYSGGCALVAATSEEEAIELFKKRNDYNNFIYDEYRCSCKLVENLTYATTEPKVFIDTIYIE